MPALRIHVAYVARDRETLVGLELEDGSTVDDAVRASGLAGRIDAAGDRPVLAICGRRVRGDTVLADGDRVDITRPLLRDPKTVRRERAKLRATQTGIAAAGTPGPRRSKA